MKRLLNIMLMLATLFNETGAQETVTFEFSDGIEASALKSKMEKQVSALLTAINRAAARGTDINYTGIDINPLASQSLGQTWNVVHFATEDNDIVDLCIQHITQSSRMRGFQVRNIGVNMIPIDDTYDGPERREIAIDFGPTGKIEDVNFTMGTTEYASLIKTGEDLNDLDQRVQLIHWCEQFMNAYNKCDIAFIHRIFSSEDLSADNQRLKGTYLHNLSQVFKRNKYINVVLSECEIQRHASIPHCYMVSITFGWNTHKYKDFGTMFLIWYFPDEDAPKLHGYSWQPMTEETFIDRTFNNNIFQYIHLQ